MFPKKKRVTKNIFLLVLKTGKIIHGSFFLFRYLKQKDPQYAFVAPKNVAKRAVDRNKMKRRGYFALRQIGAQSGLGLFFYKKEGLKTSYQDLKKDIELILKRADLN